MRWQGQKINDDTGPNATAVAPLIPLRGLVRTVRTPEFAGVTFHEVLCKSALNKVPAASSMPFTWTVNPTRGCLHRCTYCFARKTHEYLDLDAGADFDTQIVVKTNVAQVLRTELARPSWRREHVALGTSSDPYMRAEGRYRLMPGIITALAKSGTPFSILTKGPLLRRDLPLLARAREQVPVEIGVSLAFTDADLQQRVEPGTPPPKARLDLIAAITAAGLDCTVLAMPVLPWLTDSAEHLDDLFSGVRAAGAQWISAGALHLRPGAREWFLSWLAREFPALLPRYRRLYGSGSYVSADYRHWLDQQVQQIRNRHGFTRPEPAEASTEDRWQRSPDQAGTVPTALPGQAQALQGALF